MQAVDARVHHQGTRRVHREELPLASPFGYLTSDNHQTSGGRGQSAPPAGLVSTGFTQVLLDLVNPVEQGVVSVVACEVLLAQTLVQLALRDRDGAQEVVSIRRVFIKQGHLRLPRQRPDNAEFQASTVVDAVRPEDPLPVVGEVGLVRSGRVFRRVAMKLTSRVSIPFAISPPLCRPHPSSRSREGF